MANESRLEVTGTESESPELGASWPGFLDHLDADPDRAFRGFYRFTHRLLLVCPPSVCRSLDPDARQDLTHDLVLHCCRDDFRVLRKYADRGRPFAAWLQLVVRNRKTDELRRRRRRAEVPLAGDDDEPGIDPVDPGPGADDRADRRHMVERVQSALLRLSETCRLLIQGAAEGFKPRELVRLLGWPPDRNKKVSDDLRECRKRLRRTLHESGLAESELRTIFES